ncbi:hypothetical protein [Dysgonomonas sp. 521]|uniref:hypothetical protein n=1 Tax=Dysgonomonas sp. 521 TaxID=2302932 RepID=UPI0013D2898B|nr:hypothetical protein [Dysgonomonas sp. 521]
MNNRPNKDGFEINVEWLWKKRERTSLEVNNLLRKCSFRYSCLVIRDCFLKWNINAMQESVAGFGNTLSKTSKQ